MYKRLAVVLAILAVALGRDTMVIAAGLEVHVRNTRAGPMLYVNGEPMTPTVLFVNLHGVSDRSTRLSSWAKLRPPDDTV